MGKLARAAWHVRCPAGLRLCLYKVLLVSACMWLRYHPLRVSFSLLTGIVSGGGGALALSSLRCRPDRWFLRSRSSFDTVSMSRMLVVYLRRRYPSTSCSAPSCKAVMAADDDCGLLWCLSWGGSPSRDPPHDTYACQSAVLRPVHLVLVESGPSYSGNALLAL